MLPRVLIIYEESDGEGGTYFVASRDNTEALMGKEDEQVKVGVYQLVAKNTIELTPRVPRVIKHTKVK